MLHRLLIGGLVLCLLPLLTGCPRDDKTVIPENPKQLEKDQSPTAKEGAVKPPPPIVPPPVK